MPPRPFPHAIATGADICQHTRFQKYFPPLIEHTNNNNKRKRSDVVVEYGVGKVYALFDRLFTEREQKVFWLRFGTWRGIRGAERRRVRVGKWLGGRWAAKEAVIKAYAASHQPSFPAPPTSPVPSSAAYRKLFLRDIEIHINPLTSAPFGIILDPPKTTSPADSSSLSSSSDASTVKRVPAEKVFEDFRRDVLAQWPCDMQLSDKTIVDSEGQLNLDAVMLQLDRDRDVDVGGDGSVARNDGNEGDDEHMLDARHVSGQVVPLSISHDGDFVTAVALCSTDVLEGETQKMGKEESGDRRKVGAKTKTRTKAVERTNVSLREQRNGEESGVPSEDVGNEVQERQGNNTKRVYPPKTSRKLEAEQYSKYAGFRRVRLDDR